MLSVKRALASHVTTISAWPLPEEIVLRFDQMDPRRNRLNFALFTCCCFVPVAQSEAWMMKIRA